MNLERSVKRPLITCTLDDTLATAAHLLWESDLGAVPVVDARGRLVGLVTSRDISMAAYAQGRPLHTISVASAMTMEAVSCPIERSLEAAEQLMHDARLRRLPIVDDDGRPLGIVTRVDLDRREPQAVDDSSHVDRDTPARSSAFAWLLAEATVADVPQVRPSFLASY